MKLKTPIKKLSSAIALGLLATTASATTLYDTTDLFPNDLIALDQGDWAAGRFKIPTTKCPTACDIDAVKLVIDPEDAFFEDVVSLNGLSVSVYGDSGTGTQLGTKLFDLSVPAEMTKIGNFGTDVWFPVIAGENTQINAETFYWVRLENISLPDPMSWVYDDFQNGEYALINQGGNFVQINQLPFLFEVTGEPSTVSHIPIPGSVWMMGSALFGLLVSARRKVV